MVQSGGGEANEMLALLDALKPVVERAPAHVAAMKNWLVRRAGYLQSTGQWDQALALRKQVAEQYPHDANEQQQYAQALADAREYDAAYAWIAKVLGPDSRWLPHEEESLRNFTAQLMRQQGRYPELADYLAGWLKLNPESDSPYRQYLGALVYADRLEEADTVAARWLAEGEKTEKLRAGRVCPAPLGHLLCHRPGLLLQPRPHGPQVVQAAGRRGALLCPARRQALRGPGDHEQRPFPGQRRVPPSPQGDRQGAPRRVRQALGGPDRGLHRLDFAQRSGR